MRKKKDKPNDELVKLLGTDNADEQVDIIKRLMSPCIPVVIQYDGRAGAVTNVTPVGASLPPSDIHQILDDAKRWLMRLENESNARKNGQVKGEE